MLDSVRTQLKETTDRKAAMILLQGIDAPLAVFKISSPTLSGELWIRKGKYLCDAKVEGGAGGLQDMIRLLGVTEGDFDIEQSDEHPPDCPLVITLGELIADENTVIDRIEKAIAAEELAASDKSAEPSAVAEEDAAVAETASAVDSSQPVKADAIKDDVAVDATAVTEIAETAAAPAIEQSADGVPESAVMEKSLSSLFEENSPEPPAAEEVAVEPPVAQTAPVEAAAPPPLPAEASPAPPPLPVSTPAAANSSDDSLKLSPDMLNAALSLLESGGGSGKYTKEASVRDVAAALASSALESDTAQPAPAGATAEAASSSPNEAAVVKSGMTLEDLAIDPGKLEALKSLLGDGHINEAALSAATADSLESSVNYDDLNNRRQADLKALSDMLSERAENFNAKQDVSPDKWSDDLKAKRRQEYESLKDFYGEDKSQFYAETGLDTADAKKDPGLNDFQKRILEIVDEESKDPKAFREADPKLKAGGNIRPSWDDLSEAPAAAPAAEVPPPLPAQEEYVAQTVESPYAEVASSVGRAEMMKGKLAVETTDDRLDLISRPRERGGEVARAAEADFRRQPINQKLIVSTVVAVIALPIVALVTFHYFDANAQEDLDEQREAARMADRAVSEKPVAQPQEAFRMPAGGSAGPAPGPSSAENRLSEGEEPLGNQHGVYKFKAPTTQPQPMNQAEMTDANQLMQYANETIAAGQKDKALELYNSALHKYPRYMELRLMVIKTLIGVGKYRTAAQFCIEGMNMASTESDFNTLYALYRQIP